MSLEGVRFRTHLIGRLRKRLEKMGFEEIELQLSRQAQPVEPTLYNYHLDTKMVLPSSPEANLKLAMGKGVGKCFTIQHVFRQSEGVGRWHQKEFVMIEWYVPGINWEGMMEMIPTVLEQESGWPKISWVDLWNTHMEQSLIELLKPVPMKKFAALKGYTTENATWEQLFYQMTLNEIEPYFPAEPFFLVDFPAKISPLCKVQETRPYLAERFEVIMKGIEIANGNTELFDSKIVEAVMMGEMRKRSSNIMNHESIDKEFLTALQQLQGQQWAGVGLGVDRLAMILGGYNHILEVQTV